MTVLITGGLGFIGLHTSHLLAGGSSKVIIYDNLVSLTEIPSSLANNLRRFGITLVIGDICDEERLEQTLMFYKVDVVIHLAALKDITDDPDAAKCLINTNVDGLRVLIRVLERQRIRRIIFSSSAAVYGGGTLPNSEFDPTSPLSIYGESKLIGEAELRSLQKRTRSQCYILRYFNVVGSDWDMIDLDNCRRIRSDILSRISQSIRMCKPFIIYGNDHPTPDGTALRDYISVNDVARLNYILTERLRCDDISKGGLCTYNVGTGRGVSVRQLVSMHERLLRISIPTIYQDRRSFDISASVASVEYVRSRENWWATNSVGQVIAGHI